MSTLTATDPTMHPSRTHVRRAFRHQADTPLAGATIDDLIAIGQDIDSLPTGYDDDPDYSWPYYHQSGCDTQSLSNRVRSGCADADGVHQDTPGEFHSLHTSNNGGHTYVPDYTLRQRMDHAVTQQRIQDECPTAVFVVDPDDDATVIRVVSYIIPRTTHLLYLNLSRFIGKDPRYFQVCLDFRHVRYQSMSNDDQLELVGAVLRAIDHDKLVGIKRSPDGTIYLCPAVL